MINFYIRQLKGSNVGNFINCTPVIITLYNHFKEKIPVYFDVEHVKQLFLDWKMIKIIDDNERKKLKELFHCGITNTKKPDWEFLHDLIINQKLKLNIKEIPHTYCDPVEIPNEYKNKNYVVILNGCLKGSVWYDKKVIPNNIYQEIINKIKDKYEIVLCGNDDDWERLKYLKGNFIVELNNIRRIVGILRGAKFIIANDTGLYHVASCFDKKIFVMIKDTIWPKIKSPNPNAFYSFKNNWLKDFDKFLKC